MLEKNKYILERSIRKLPDYKPRNDFWQSIENSLNHAENGIHLSKLPIYYPRENFWRSIEKNLPGYLPLYKRRWFKLGLISFAIIIILFMWLLNIPFLKNEDTTGQNKVKTETTFIQNTSAYDSKIKKGPDNSQAKVNHSGIRSLPNDDSPGHKTMNKSKSHESKTLKYPVFHTPEKNTGILSIMNKGTFAGYSNSDTTENGRHEANTPFTKVAGTKLLLTDDLKPQELPLYELTRINNPISSLKVPVLPDFHKVPGWQVGFCYSKALYELPKNIMGQNAFTFGLSTLFEKNNFILQTGPQIGIVGYDINYDINYRVWDVSGHYFDVDSVTYNVYYDSILHQNIIQPVYHSTLKPLFDSLPQNKYCLQTQRNTYLKLPLLFGYKKDFGRFCFTFKNGPVLNFLLHSRKDNNPDIEDQFLKEVLNKKYFTSRSFYYYYLLSFSTGYRFQKRLMFSIESGIGFMAKPMLKDDKSSQKLIKLETHILYIIN